MSRSRNILLGFAIISFTLIVILFLFPHHLDSSLDIQKIHNRHHNTDENDEQVGERKIDKEELHEDEGKTAVDESHHDDVQKNTNNQNKFHPTSRFRSDLMNKLTQPLLPKKILQLYAGSVMPEFTYKRIHPNDVVDEKDESLKYLKKCPEWLEKDSASNIQFAVVFSKLLREKFPPEKGGALDGSGLHWFLDEGGLIGSSRAGSLRNADDDFDFFLLLPNLHMPCRADSLTCTPDEFNSYIHKFLMVFHNEGMCINKFSPDPKRFKSKGRLMYSFQLNRGAADPEACFQEKKPFAHMHLGIFDEQGKVCTNVWIPAHSTHSKDKLDLDVMLPVTRCRAGAVEVPCPQNITGFLTERNQGEYRKRSSDGSCLVVKKKWGLPRKKQAASTLRALDACGYNSIIDLLPEFERTGYKDC